MSLTAGLWSSPSTTSDRSRSWPPAGTPWPPAGRSRWPLTEPCGKAAVRPNTPHRPHTYTGLYKHRTIAIVHSRCYRVLPGDSGKIARGASASHSAPGPRHTPGQTPALAELHDLARLTAGPAPGLAAPTRLTCRHSAPDTRGHQGVRTASRVHPACRAVPFRPTWCDGPGRPAHSVRCCPAVYVRMDFPS
jgi:hypothetical protein